MVTFANLGIILHFCIKQHTYYVLVKNKFRGSMYKEYPETIIRSFKITMYLNIHSSLINTTFSISTPVQYYLNANNIDTVIIFISSAPSNSTACHFTTPGITVNYCVMMIISSIPFKL